MVLILSRNTLWDPFLGKRRVQGSGENYTVGWVTELPLAFKIGYVLPPPTEELELCTVALPRCTAGWYITPTAKAGMFCLMDVPAAVRLKGVPTF